MAERVKEGNASDQSNKNDDILIENSAKTKDKEPSKKKKEKKEKKAKKGIASRVIPIIILLAVVSFLVGVLGFNLLDIRDRYIYPQLRNVPIIGGLLPPEESEPPDEYDGLSREDLIERINSLNTELERVRKQISEINVESEKSDTELNRLRDLEEQYLQFRADQAEFERMVAEGDPRAYAEFYESILPDNAAELYKEAVVANQMSEEVRRFVRTFVDMDESNSAKIMEQWIPTDTNLIVDTLNNMSPDRRAAILAAMLPENAAVVSKLMSPF